MKTKKLLFGLIEINATMYNILYTLLYVVVWLIIYLFLAFALCKLNDTGLISELPWHNIALWIVISYLTGYKFFHKNNYI